MPYQRVTLTAFGGPEKLRLVEEPLLPEPGPNEVRVRVCAAGTGFTDTIIRRGNYPGVKEKPPFTPGYDFVGIVDALGPGVSGLALGEKVADMPVIGSYAQYIVRRAEDLVSVPPEVDDAEAACMPLSFLTAYQMLTRLRKFQPGDRILIHGASGATGSALLVLGAHFGLRMYGTCSRSKFGLLAQYGCTPIDYRNEDFVVRIEELTEDGVDAVFDAIGGSHWNRSHHCLRRGGLLVGYGAQNAAKGQDSTIKVLLGFFKLMVWWKLRPDGRQAVFYNIHTRRTRKPGEFTADLRALFELLKAGSIKPVVAGTYPLAEVQAVHEKIDRGEVLGKIVLLPFAS